MTYPEDLGIVDPGLLKLWVVGQLHLGQVDAVVVGLEDLLELKDEGNLIGLLD